MSMSTSRITTENVRKSPASHNHSQLTVSKSPTTDKTSCTLEVPQNNQVFDVSVSIMPDQMAIYKRVCKFCLGYWEYGAIFVVIVFATIWLYFLEL